MIKLSVKSALTTLGTGATSIAIAALLATPVGASPLESSDGHSTKYQPTQQTAVCTSPIYLKKSILVCTPIDIKNVAVYINKTNVKDSYKQKKSYSQDGSSHYSDKHHDKDYDKYDEKNYDKDDKKYYKKDYDKDGEKYHKKDYDKHDDDKHNDGGHDDSKHDDGKHEKYNDNYIAKYFREHFGQYFEAYFEKYFEKYSEKHAEKHGEEHSEKHSEKHSEI